ncbi:MAG TPA: nucleotide-binding protein [Pyrinomonadaceae bacterium]|nr:nucleotide-binding protein [Pyrinomonadaceae bacterium]
MNSVPSSANEQPVVFIGSASEGLKVANKITKELLGVADCRIWEHGVFGLSQGTLESLIAMTRSADFAILVVTPDDLATKKGKRTYVPRDNIIFEIGLFMGAIGRERTFIVCSEAARVALPSDLEGITTAVLTRPKKSFTDVGLLLRTEIGKRGRRDGQPPSSGAMLDLLGTWKCTWVVGTIGKSDYHTIKDQITVTRVIGEKIFASGLNTKFGNYELIGRITPGGVLTFYYEGDAKRHFSGGVLILKLGISSREKMKGYWYEFDANREIYGGDVAWSKT